MFQLILICIIIPAFVVFAQWNTVYLMTSYQHVQPPIRCHHNVATVAICMHKGTVVSDALRLQPSGCKTTETTLCILRWPRQTMVRKTHREAMPIIHKQWYEF